MDARWVKILVERGRIKLDPLPSESARAKYRRTQDLLKLPRNPDEKAARRDLAIHSEGVPEIVKRAQKQAVLLKKAQSEIDYRRWLRKAKLMRLLIPV